MNPNSATLTADTRLTTRGSKRAFARHFAEMLVAMLVGMIALGGLSELIFAVGGSSMSDQSGALQITLMGLNMTVPMVLWMSYRGHPAQQNAEMAASMIVPSLVAAVLTWAGALGTAAGLGLQHAVMIPAMLAVMAWRYEHYSQPHS
jgi:hypothetical protein